MKKTTLLIMAAGIGSRFGGGIKQLEPVGLHNEIREAEETKKAELQETIQKRMADGVSAAEILEKLK